MPKKSRFAENVSRLMGSNQTALIIVASYIGILGGFGAVGFRYSIRFFQWIFWRTWQYTLPYVQGLPWYAKLIPPALGGLIVGPIVQIGSALGSTVGQWLRMSGMRLKTLVGGLATGFVLAVFMANAGGAWDNAKKYIEEGNLGGKGSDAHKAAVIGDTVGDPFKDTSGPSLNILIKLMSMVSIVMAGITVAFSLL